MKLSWLLVEHFDDTDDPYVEPEWNIEPKAKEEWIRAQREHTVETLNIIGSRLRRVEAELMRIYNLTPPWDMPTKVKATRGYKQILPGVALRQELVSRLSDPLVAQAVQLKRKSNHFTNLSDQLSHAALLIQMPDYDEIMKRQKEHNEQQKQQNAVKRVQNKNTIAVDFPALKPTAPSITIDPANIPTRIVIPGRGGKGLENPYYLTQGMGTAGSPFDAPLHPSQQLILVVIQKTLIKHGVKPLTIMYYGRHTGNEVNFIAVNADRSIVWRKYDAGGGSGQNTLYLNGKEYHTSSFMLGDDQYREDALRKSGLIP